MSMSSVFRPFRAGASDGYNDPGRRHARKTRVALPWADMWLPRWGDVASHMEFVRVRNSEPPGPFLSPELVQLRTAC